MSKPTRIEVNCTTGEQRIVDLTDAEIAEFQIMNNQMEAERAEREAVAQAKADAKLNAQAKLQALGLTGEEIAAITN